MFVISDYKRAVHCKCTSSSPPHPHHTHRTRQYESGSIAVYPLSSSPPHLPTLTPPKIVEFKGEGLNKDRQDSSHAHQVIMHPEREELLVLDLGADKVWRLSKSKGDGGEGGGWEISGDVSYSPGSGPRHAVLYGKLSLFSCFSHPT